MTADYVDNWDRLPRPVQEALAPIIARFDTAADLLFDRRLNLSFEAAVKELAIPGIVALTDALRQLRHLLETRITIADADHGELLFDERIPLTAYDLPLYTPCIYLSQLAQRMDSDNVRVWKESTALEIVAILLLVARCLRPDIETARVCIAAVHDMASLYPNTTTLLQQTAAPDSPFPNAQRVAVAASRLLAHR